MKIITRLAVGVSVALLAGACNNPLSLPAAPTQTTAVPTTSAGPPVCDVPRSFPAMSRPARI